MSYRKCYVRFEDKLAADNFNKQVEGTLWVTVSYIERASYMVEYLVKIEGGDKL